MDDIIFLSLDMRFSFLIANQLIRDNYGVVIWEYLTFLIDKIWFDLQDK